MLNSNKHNYTIDLLRFLAAFMVVLFHLNQPIVPLNNWYRNLVAHGWLGVPVFFVISGFCIMLSSQHSNSSKVFLKKRFFRIYPSYWASLLIVLFAAIIQKVFTGYNSVSHIPSGVIPVIANITLLTAPVSSIPTVNWVYWSLTCEVFFYLVIAITMFKKEITVYFVFAVSVLAAFLHNQQTGGLFFLYQWPAFGCGVSIFYFFKYPPGKSLIIAALLLMINIYGLFQKQPVEYLIAALSTAAIILISNYIRLPKNLFSAMGEQSYAVYLIHVPIGVFILGWFKVQYIQQHLLANLLYDLAVYAVISLLAWQFFKWIEKPSIKLGKERITSFYQLKKLYKP